MSGHVRRRLAAILAADVVGYSRLMREEEARTLSALRTVRDDILAPAVTSNRGELIKSMGDGWLIEFQSVVDAISCAIKVQRELAEIDVLQLRIGIHVGELIHEAEDVFGDGVNVAARLEGIAAPGCIIISADAYKLDRDKSGRAFQDLGPVSLKNISEDLGVFGWPADLPKSELLNVTQSGISEGRLPVIGINSFVPAGDDQVTTELAAEIVENLTYRMSRRAGIRVAAAANDDCEVDYALDGRLRTFSGRYRLILSITSSERKQRVWGERFEGEMEDVLATADALTAKIEEAVRLQVLLFDGRSVADQPDEDLSTEDLLSKAAGLFYRFEPASGAAARRATALAYARAPDNPRVLAMHAYAQVHLLRALHEYRQDIDTNMTIKLINRAVDLSPGIDHIFNQRAIIRLYLQRDSTGCRADAQRALEVNPNYPYAVFSLGNADLSEGKFEAAISKIGDVIEAIPKDPHVPLYLSSLSLVHLLAGSLSTGIELAKESFDLRPSLPFVSLAYVLAACDDEAFVASDEFRDTIEMARLSVSTVRELPLTRDEDIAFLEGRLRKAGVPESHRVNK
jgi:adenylate cyclase